MAIVREQQTPKTQIAEKRERYLSHTEHLMMAVIDFTDGPTEHSDPPHHHVHEQITYVAQGEINFFLDGRPHKLTAGDMVTVPPNVPHAVQLLSAHVRLVDTFSPVRDDFLGT